MTFGEQNTRAEAFEQLDCALDYGVNTIDVAEMYPVPPRSTTQGESELIVGQWLTERQCREQIILATKATGSSQGNGGFDYIRGGPRLNRQHLRAAVEGSLKRLQTDYIDLYQLHWPERATNFFGQLGYTHLPPQASEVPLEESLSALDELIREGKIRSIGLSNETPWGVMHALSVSHQCGLTPVVSIQNPYNLLNRTYEIGLAEISMREHVGLLAYSPLAFGVLSGKYLNGAKPKGARLTISQRFTRYSNESATMATEAYMKVAKKHNLNPSQMALAFVNRQPFLTSNIIGATSLEQLRCNLASTEVTLHDDILVDIDNVHRRFTNPAP